MPALRVVVSGRVQGVGFRYFVYQTAESLAADGEVWNRSDRKVEAYIQHFDPIVLQEIVARLWDGPGRVEDVAVESTPEQPFEGFQIVRQP